MGNRLRRSQEELPKADWGPGPWQAEPDRVEWTTAAGLPGLMVRNPAGAWCGYAAVPPSHPLHEVWYGACVHKHYRRSRKTILRRARRRIRRAKPDFRYIAEMNYRMMTKGHRAWMMGREQACTELRKGPKGYRRSCQTPEGLLEVHGGITYSNGCRGEICHVPAPGTPDNVWWFGFDCSHYMDFSPAMEARMDAIYAKTGEKRERVRTMETYKDLPYVKGEVEALARQLVDYEQRYKRR